MNRLSAGWIQNQRGVLRRTVEVQHRYDPVRDRVEGARDPLSAEPVILDEANGGDLGGQRVIDEVGSRVRRDHQERQARPVAAAALRMRVVAGSKPGRAASPLAALPRAGQCVGAARRLVEDRRHHVIVPAVRIVPRDHYRGGTPLRRLLELVEHGYDKGLLVQRVGVAGMTFLEAGRLDEADRRQVASGERGEEVVGVVVMIGRVGRGTELAVLARRNGGTRMSQVLRGRVVLEGAWCGM